MTLLKGEPKGESWWSGAKIDEDWEEEQRELATLVQVKVLEDKFPVRVQVQQQESDGTWTDLSAEVDLGVDESTEQTVDGRDLPRRLIVTEVRT